MSSSFQNFKKYCASFIVALILLNNITISVASTLQNSENSDSEKIPKQNKADEETAVDDEILGLGKTIFIVICVVAGVVVIIILVACCFCFACLCFAKKSKKSKLDTPVQVYQNQPNQGVSAEQHHNSVYLQQQQQQQQQPQQQHQQHQQQQPYAGAAYYNEREHNHGPVDNNVARYENNYHHQVNQPPPSYNQHQHSQPYPTTDYQKASSPPHHMDHENGHGSDPNLIVNRFKPTVPPKPRDRIPGWTAVTAEVKKRTQLHRAQQNQYDNEYIQSNEGYEPDSMSPSPVPQSNYNQHNTNDNLMY